MTAEERRHTLMFGALALAWSWGIAAVYLGTGHTIGGGVTTLFLGAYSLGPGLAALVVHKLIAKRSVVEIGLRFGLSGWLFVCWLGPVLFMIASVMVSSGIPGVDVDPLRAALTQARAQVPAEELAAIEQRIREQPFAALFKTVPGIMIAGATANALVALGPELGWRGLLTRQLADHGFWTVSAWTGAAGALWLAPLAWFGYPYPAGGPLALALTTVWWMLAAPILLHIRLHARSVIPTAVLLGTLTAASGTPSFLLVGGDPHLVGVYGAAGMLLLLVLDGVVYWRLRARARTGPSPRAAQ